MPAATACASRGVDAGREPDDGVPGVQDAGAAAHRAPARGRVLGGVRLAEDLAVELEHRVAADDDPVEVRDVVGEPRGDIRGLAAREQQHVLVGRERAALGRLDRRDDGVLVDVGRDGERAGCRTAAAA